jgi:hypothetical protein
MVFENAEQSVLTWIWGGNRTLLFARFDVILMERVPACDTVSLGRWQVQTY